MKFKRLTAVLITVAMTVGMIPTIVFADDAQTEPAETSAVQTTEPEETNETKETKESANETAESKELETSESEGKKPEQIESVEPSESNAIDPSESGEKEPEVTEKGPDITAKRKATNEGTTDILITVANCNVSRPIPGNTPDMNPTSSDSSKYYIGLECWYLNEAGYKTLSSTDHFELNKSYCLRVRFFAKDGYKFDESTIFKINNSATTNFFSALKSSEVGVEMTFAAKYVVSLNVKTYTSTGTGFYMDGRTGGNPKVDHTYVLPGDVVTIIPNMNIGFYLKKIEWYDDDTPKTDITSNWSFKVGTSNPTVNVYFQADPKEYSISCSLPFNGKIDISKSKALAGEVVSVDAIPNSGYYVEKITWKVDGTLTGLTEYDITADKSFIMPNNDVLIKVYFQPQIDNPMTVKSKTAKLKYKKLKKKAQTVANSKVMTVRNAQGSLNYSLVSVKRGKSKKYKKYFKINATTGNVTVKKKLKKGTYKITCKVTSGGEKYKSVTKTVTFKIKVK